jgi:phage repressor protein C with HTH and peptisase S24 domain
MPNNLKSIRQRLGWSQEQAASALETTVPQYGKLERGERRLSERWIDRAAQGFGVDPGEVVENPRRRLALVVGYVGAGAVIVPIDDVPAGARLDEVEAPVGAPDGVVAVIVRGDSMYPRYFDGERLFYIQNHQPPQDFIGKECILQLADGGMLVKILRRGTRPGVFNLESWNAPLIENQVVEWAAPVRWTERQVS